MTSFNATFPIRSQKKLFNRKQKMVEQSSAIPPLVSGAPHKRIVPSSDEDAKYFLQTKQRNKHCLMLAFQCVYCNWHGREIQINAKVSHYIQHGQWKLTICRISIHFMHGKTAGDERLWSRLHKFDRNTKRRCGFNRLLRHFFSSEGLVMNEHFPPFTIRLLYEKILR